MLLKSGARVGTTIIQDNFYQMDNIEKAKNRLIHFIKEMSAWEIACEEIDEQDIEEIEKLRQKIIIKMYLIENKEVTLLVKLNR